jgi:hypothetical protein
VFDDGDRISWFEGRGPASEQFEGLRVAVTGFGGVGEDGEAWVGGEVHAVVDEAEVADDRVVEVLDASDVLAHVVLSPCEGALRARVAHCAICGSGDPSTHYPAVVRSEK